MVNTRMSTVNDWPHRNSHLLLEGEETGLCARERREIAHPGI